MIMDDENLPALNYIPRPSFSSDSRLAFRRGPLTVLLIAALSFRGGISQDGGEDVTGRMRLLSYFPCITALSPDECDVFAYAAAELAVEEVNWFISSDSFPGGALDSVVFELIPVSEAGDDPDAVSFDSSELWLDDVAGVIGPFYPDVAARVIPIAMNNLDVLSITYAVTDASIGMLYRSLPSDKFLSEARLRLLLHFKWLKIGVLSSTQQSYCQEANIFRQLFPDWFQSQGYDLQIAYFGTFIMSTSPEHTLDEMANSDIGLKIILGYFGPRDARRVICMANKLGLVSQDHVWILPSYSTPFWWELSDTDLQMMPEKERCSNDEMDSLLESTIFFHAVKLPAFDSADYIDLNAGESTRNTTGEQFVNNSVLFYDRLERKAQELFPELYCNGTQPLERYLYSSQAQRAYEATWLMSWSLTQVLRNNGNTSQVEWLEITMYCEMCRIYNECLLLHEELLKQNLDLCNKCMQEQYNATFHELIKDYYGQIVASQHTDGLQCPVATFFSITPGNITMVLPSDSEDQCYPESLLINSIPFNASCPLDFRWKGGRATPPISGFSFTISLIPRWGAIFNTIFASLVFIYGTIILVINIIWRNNALIKTSSPRVNILLIVPLMIFPWYTVLKVFEYSALPWNISLTATSVTCMLTEWIYFLLQTVFYATLLVKNVRVYRIFHNQRLVSELRLLSDAALVLQVVLFSLPASILLIAWTVVDPRTAQVATVNRTGTTYDYNYVSITYCSTQSTYPRYGFIIAYLLMLAASATMFGFLNSRIPTRYREGSAASYRAVAILILLLVVKIFVDVILLDNLSTSAMVVWAGSFFCTIVAVILTILFVPRFVRAYLEYRKLRLLYRERALSVQLSDKLLALESERTQLQQELTEKEKK